MDLSDGSAQPMIDSQLGLSLAFNGAIYNFPELRAELEALGYAFYSGGDTEVLLKGYHAWGERCCPNSTACSPSPSGSATPSACSSPATASA
jgi:asparagine synthase (glutamine-hydrolysing)